MGLPGQGRGPHRIAPIVGQGDPRADEQIAAGLQALGGHEFDHSARLEWSARALRMIGQEPRLHSAGESGFAGRHTLDAKLLLAQGGRVEGFTALQDQPLARVERPCVG
jgi:hypothetical protein